MVTKSDFEQTISELTQPLKDKKQFPRPWMTTLTDPLSAEVFVVGKNQAKGYPLSIGHKRHMDSLFNRNGETCRGLYDEVTIGSPSPTRTNIDKVVRILKHKGISNILESNVICYSSPMSDDLKLENHAGGAERGRKIFSYLYRTVMPRVILVHGVGAMKELCKVIGLSQLRKPEKAEDIVSDKINNCLVIAIPSLSPPPYNLWKSWADEHIRLVSDEIKKHLQH